MEKLSQFKRKLLKFLPKQPMASVVTFHHKPTLSPCRSSPARMISIIPKEARIRRKHKGGGRSASFSAREPTSPKVSCMGQVHGKKKKRKHHNHKKEPPIDKRVSIPCLEKKKEKIMLWISKGCDGLGPKQSGKAFDAMQEKASTTTVIAPSLGAMKKFASGRDSLCNFDVTLAER